jgi:hypothetical protein
MENINWFIAANMILSFTALFSVLVLALVVVRQQDIITELINKRFRDDTK